MADWGRQTLEQFRALGERLQAGPLQQMDGLGPQSHVTWRRAQECDFCIGWEQDLSAGQIQRIHEESSRIMGLLNFFAKPTTLLLPLPRGSFTVDREGACWPRRCRRRSRSDCGRHRHAKCSARFNPRRRRSITLREIIVRYANLKVTARELRGGAIIFLVPQTLSGQPG